MENLFFALIFNKQMKRQIKILKYLSENNFKATYRELMEISQSTLPTLKSDVEQLNEILSDDIKVMQQQREGYELIYPNNMSIEFYISDLAKKSFMYAIIENVINNKIISIDELADELFISTSALRKKLEQANRVLRKYKIRLNISKVDFIGKEEDIRFFMYMYLYDFQDYFSVADKKSEEVYIDLVGLAQHNNLLRLHLSDVRMNLWTKITTKRIAGNKHVNLNLDNFRREMQEVNYQKFKLFFEEYLKTTFKLEIISESEILWGYLIGVSAISYAQSNVKRSDTIRSHSREISEDTLEVIDKVIYRVLPQSYSDYEGFKLLQAYLNNVHILARISKTFEMINSELKEFVKFNYRRLYNKWYLALINLKEEDFYKIEHVEDVAVSLTILHSNLLNDIMSIPINIIFTFQGENGFDALLVNESKQLIIKGVKAKYIFEKKITNEVIKEYQADLVVSNYALCQDEKINCETYRLSFIPQRCEWFALKSKIIELTQGN